MSSVDVVVPCFRYEHFLRECVQSVLAQSGPRLRLLIIDDASPDDTAEVAAELVRSDARVDYRRHVSNRGLIATANEGIAWQEPTTCFCCLR
ncbi:glycosyltransferase family 2 protein [Bradyrhizobium sp. 159]|uniref:glycosyltransferase family 2 protein n=1 Tax=Bradyrhizobium sp. 159 TaxID=2782632 RepID=UPI001FF9A15E|nr:glycosyltransferase family 2 protein [Bradyrhizobium sp. 159]